MTQQDNDGVDCHGNGIDHCCYVNGAVCQYLETDTIPGRHWVCGLRRSLGSWLLVHLDLGYIANIKSVWDLKEVTDCGDWRIEGQCCFGAYEPVEW